MLRLPGPTPPLPLVLGVLLLLWTLFPPRHALRTRRRSEPAEPSLRPSLPPHCHHHFTAEGPTSRPSQEREAEAYPTLATRHAGGPLARGGAPAGDPAPPPAPARRGLVVLASASPAAAAGAGGGEAEGVRVRGAARPGLHVGGGFAGVRARGGGRGGRRAVVGGLARAAAAEGQGQEEGSGRRGWGRKRRRRRRLRHRGDRRRRVVRARDTLRRGGVLGGLRGRAPPDGGEARPRRRGGEAPQRGVCVCPRLPRFCCLLLRSVRAQISFVSKGSIGSLWLGVRALFKIIITFFSAGIVACFLSGSRHFCPLQKFDYNAINPLFNLDNCDYGRSSILFKGQCDWL